MKKIVFTGGGTLGHVMPNLYLIEDLKHDNEIFYIGSGGIEKTKIEQKGVKFYEIPAIKLKRGKIFENFKIPFVLINAICKAKKILKEIKPDIIFSKGGYVSLPVCIAGKMLKIPIIAHESDSSFGLANKIILKLCNIMCVNFKSLDKINDKIIYTGPIFSKTFESSHKNTIRLNLEENKKTLLIVGGSLGSQIINQNIQPILDETLLKFNIIHITGKGNNKIMSYKNYNAFEMVDDMPCLYNNADFVIGRSGAGVTAECFYKNLPMILIPLENGSSRGDQLENANYYKNLGVAEILRESDLNCKSLKECIDNFSSNLQRYKEKYKNITKINGRQKIIDMITSLTNKK